MLGSIDGLSARDAAFGAHNLVAAVSACNGADCSLYGTIGCLGGCVLAGGVGLAVMGLGGNGVMAAVVIATAP